MMTDDLIYTRVSNMTDDELIRTAEHSQSIVIRELGKRLEQARSEAREQKMLLILEKRNKNGK